MNFQISWLLKIGTALPGITGRTMNKRNSLCLLAATQVAVLSLWFAATAVLPALTQEFALGNAQQAYLTSAVQAGFVVGSLVSAIFGLADRIEPRKFYAVCAFTGAAANALFTLVDPGTAGAVALRFATGAVMAGVYPIGMKMAVSWANRDAGLLVGALVGALTIGSAMPHLFAFSSGIGWRSVMLLASLGAACGGIAIMFVGIGPNFTRGTRFNPRTALNALRVPALRYANLGYLGHMWELYAMWAWIGAFIAASFTASGVADAATHAKLAAFATVAIGAIGALGGGWLADRIGRTALTAGAMTLSGLCCLTVGFAFAGNPTILMIICLVWGIAVIADSAQFSASITELSPPDTQGTMLTVQTAMGFALTLITIQAMPYWVEIAGWQYAFAPLALGPFAGVVAMLRLRAMPEAIKLASGRK